MSNNVIFFSKASRPALGPKLNEYLRPGSEAAMLEANCSPSPTAEAKNTWSYISTSPYAFVASAPQRTGTILPVMCSVEVSYVTMQSIEGGFTLKMETAYFF
jgi:hypothetical protein